MNIIHHSTHWHCIINKNNQRITHISQNAYIRDYQSRLKVLLVMTLTIYNKLFCSSQRKKFTTRTSLNHSCKLTQQIDFKFGSTNLIKHQYIYTKAFFQNFHYIKSGSVRWIRRQLDIVTMLRRVHGQVPLRPQWPSFFPSGWTPIHPC